MVKLLNQKIRILSKEYAAIEDEAHINDELGNSLIESFVDAIRPTEAIKCRAYITDVGHITGLLLSLTERLIRTENRLSSSTFDYIDKVKLLTKKEL